MAVARRRHLRQRPSREGQLAREAREPGAPRWRRPGGRSGSSGGPRPRRWSMAASASHRAAQVAGCCVRLSNPPPDMVSSRTLTTNTTAGRVRCGEGLRREEAQRKAFQAKNRGRAEAKLYKFWYKAERNCTSSETRQSAVTATITAVTYAQTTFHTRHDVPGITAAADAVNATSAGSSANDKKGGHRQCEPSRVIL